MSNYLLKLQVNEVQAELNALDAYTRQQVFAGGLHNPLGSPMLCQLNDIVGARNISGQSLNIADGATLGYLTSGGIDATSFSQTYDGTTYASIISGVVTATKVSTDTIESKTAGGIITVDSEINTGNFISSGIIQAAEFQQMGSGVPQVTITGGGVNCITLDAYNIAGTDAGTVNMLTEVDMNSHPISNTNYIGFNGQVAGAPYLTIQNNATLTTRGFGYSELGGVDPVIFYDNKYNPPPGSGSVGSLEQVLTEGSTAPDKTMSVLGVTTASLTAADPLIGITLNNSIAGNSKDITGVGTISASIVGAPSVNSTTLTTTYITGTNSAAVNFNNDITMEQHNITNVDNLTIGTSSVYNTLSTGGTNPAQLYITRDGTTFGSVYDSHYNQPPSSGGSQNLSQVLTEGNTAPLQTLSVLGITTAALGSPNLDGIQLNNMLVCNGQAITGVDGISLFNYNTTPNKFSTLTTGYLGGDSGTLYLNHGSGYGAIYDSLYNQPPSAAIPTLTEVLTANNSAPDIGMTVFGVNTKFLAGPTPTTGVTLSNDIIANNKNITGVGELQIVNTTDPTKITQLTTGTSAVNDNNLWVYHDSRGYGIIYDTLYNTVPIDTLTQVLTANNSAPALDMTVKGVTADTVDATTSVTTNTITGTGTLDGFTVLNMGSAVNMNNYPVTHTPYVGFNGEGVNNTPALYKTIQNKSTSSYTGFGYSDYGGGDPVTFYDNKYNLPPSTPTPNLDEVLTAGASATSKTITVGGITTDAIVSNAALGIIVNGNLIMKTTATQGSSLFVMDTAGNYNAISTITDGALGPTLSVTRDGGTTNGFIYDSHYNQPPTAAASTLEEVLAANSVALGTQSITVGSLVGNHAVDSTHTDEYLAVGSDVDYSLYSQLNIRSSSIVDPTGVNKNTLLTSAPFSGSNEKQLYITRGDGQYGAVYDSHYNQPPAPNSSSSTLVIPNNNLFNTFVDLAYRTPDPGFFIWGTVGEFNFATTNTDFNTFTLTYDTFTILNPSSDLAIAPWTMYLSTSFDAYYADIPVGFISLNSLNFQTQTGTNLVLSKGLLQSVMNPGLESNKVFLMWFTEVRDPVSLPLSLAFTNLQVLASSAPISNDGGFTPNSS